jgi:hypothetical protein
VERNVQAELGACKEKGISGHVLPRLKSGLLMSLPLSQRHPSIAERVQ